MTEIEAIWRILVRLSEAEFDTAKYNRWARINLEPDKTLLTINAAMFQAAMAEFALHEAKTALLQRFDVEERTADW